jgi:Dynein heavy chain C-terminal domain
MRALPDAHSPAWLGLPVQAESQLKSFIGQRALSTLAQLQGVESANTASASDKNALQTRNKGALEAAARWLAALPSSANMASLAPEGSDPASLSSLQRCLLREVAKGRGALSLVRSDLETIKYVYTSSHPTSTRSLTIRSSCLTSIQIERTSYLISRLLLLHRSHCEGDTKATNSLRKLMTSLTSGLVPSAWRAEYPSPTDTGISSWVADLVSRSEALDRYRPMFRTKEAVSGTRYWMGGMFNPHSFITATRQHSAQVLSVTILIHLFDFSQISELYFDHSFID